MDEEGLRQAEAEVLAEEQAVQAVEAGAGEHPETAGGVTAGETGKSRFQQRIDQLVAERKAAEERAATAERAAAEARASADTAERIARERSGSTDTDSRPLSGAERRELVKRQFRAGEIDDDTRVERLAEIVADDRLARADQVSGARQILQSTADEIEGWKRIAPDLSQAGSDLRQRVQKVFQRLVSRGYPANDLRTELTAVEQAMGASLQDYQRRRGIDDFTAESLPRGGAGTGGPGGGGRGGNQPKGTYGEQLFARLTSDALTEMRRLYTHAADPDAEIKKDLEYADEETLWRRGRLKSR